jgi:hypothetical protein
MLMSAITGAIVVHRASCNALRGQGHRRGRVPTCSVDVTSGVQLAGEEFKADDGVDDDDEDNK